MGEIRPRVSQRYADGHRRHCLLPGQAAAQMEKQAGDHAVDAAVPSSVVDREVVKLEMAKLRRDSGLLDDVFDSDDFLHDDMGDQMRWQFPTALRSHRAADLKSAAAEYFADEDGTAEPCPFTQCRELIAS